MLVFSAGVCFADNCTELSDTERCECLENYFLEDTTCRGEYKTCMASVMRGSPTTHTEKPKGPNFIICPKAAPRFAS